MLDARIVSVEMLLVDVLENDVKALLESERDPLSGVDETDPEIDVPLLLEIGGNKLTVIDNDDKMLDNNEETSSVVDKDWLPDTTEDVIEGGAGLDAEVLEDSEKELACVDEEALLGDEDASADEGLLETVLLEVEELRTVVPPAESEVELDVGAVEGLDGVPMTRYMFNA